MTGWRIHDFGSPDVFRKEQIEKPVPARGELLVRVKATSVNPADYFIRSGEGAAFIDGLPKVLHSDVAGIVEKTGEGVSQFKEGDALFACAGGFGSVPGALADYMIVDEALAARKPRNLTFAEAAALPLVSITAWEGLIDKARIQQDQTVLIHGATGGVGHIAMQLAKWRGAKVFATGSHSEKLRIARELGADGVINYKEASVNDYVQEHTNGLGFDVVFDTIGDENLSRSFEAARLHGTVACTMTGAIPDPGLLNQKGLTLHAVMMVLPIVYNWNRSHHGEILTEVARLADEGTIQPLIDPQSFTFEEIAQAHTHAASGKQVGKVVLVNSNH